MALRMSPSTCHARRAFTIFRSVCNAHDDQVGHASTCRPCQHYSQPLTHFHHASILQLVVDSSITNLPIPIVSLTTDFGLEDWYVAAMKAVLLHHAPTAR